eukprot:gene6155-10162_t
MKIFTTLLFILVIGFTVAKKVDPNIILSKTNKCKVQGALLFEGKNNLKETTTLTQIHEIIKKTYIQKRGKFVKDVFRQPLANLLINIDGLDSSILPNPKLENLAILSGVSQEKKCESYGSSVSRLVSLMTGKCPLDHKIYSPFIIHDNGQAYGAFTRQKTYAEVSNLADELLQNYKEPTVVSASSDELLAKATASISFSKNFKTLFWKNNEFEGFMNKKQLFEELSKVTFGQLEGDVFTVKFNQQQVKFSLTEQEDLTLLAEIIAFKTLIERIPKVTSTSPSLYTLTFASLKGINSKYGRKSLKFETSVYLVDKIISEIIPTFADRFESRTTTEVALIGGMKNSLIEDNKNVVEKLENALDSNLLIKFKSVFPLVYLKKIDKETEDRLCQEVKEIAQNEFKVSCLNEKKQIKGQRQLFNFAEILQTNTTTNTTDNTLAIADWQTSLWAGVIIAVAVFLALYVVNLIEYNDITSYIVVDIQEKAIYERDH